MSGGVDGNVCSTCKLYPFVKSAVPSVAGCAAVCAEKQQTWIACIRNDAQSL